MRVRKKRVRVRVSLDQDLRGLTFELFGRWEPQKVFEQGRIIKNMLLPIHLFNLRIPLPGRNA